ncbi:DUF3422 domain-containing protein [Tabrizicola sp. J26]|uniref:DUF3422 family protein n=1 Tax=Alitabrizicola rongguiensis TaxID=2909234 RepID=UPI001F3ECC22|nr:DUF3422 domain-containing protein [Tabrizicola rongguiensis]MCF1707208.1 DUF3422 domain-containing protein [Tabrizicola rongguiensis]
MAPIDDHPLRYALTNELHARPFPTLQAPCTAVFLAIKQPGDAANRDRDREREHLLALLDRHGSPHPQPDATHFSGSIGRHELKWESHTEFVTYSAFSSGVSARPFDPAEMQVFPDDWLESAPGTRLVALMVRVEPMPKDEAEISAKLEEWFVPESLACSRVVDDVAIIAGDFRIDPAGITRFAVFVRPDTGARRIGRIVQRLCEIETYRTTSMLGLIRARKLNGRLNGIDMQLSELAGRLDDAAQSAETTLHRLLAISAELESLASRTSFRFAATSAYEAIVNQRIEVLREERLGGRQTFGEFMMRRYDPAMRTVKSAQTRLTSLIERAQRAADLLRTRVDVERSAQNQKLLESMDRRADLQLKLQRTVEGLSVVAISYYAVNLAAYAAYPLTEPLHIDHGTAMAMFTPIIVLLVWLGIRRIHKKID